MFDDGRLTIYKKDVADGKNGVFDNAPLEEVGTAYYGEISFTAEEYYLAKQANTEITKRVQIHQDKSIGNNHVIIIDKTQYNVGRTYSTVKKGVAVTEISLERVIQDYDIAGT
ncbi:MAG: phage head closure protein [Defluviitaleaceae bacterium]|nr:phage head closure protein [Defluviitaleaceae bacterium]